MASPLTAFNRAVTRQRDAEKRTGPATPASAGSWDRFGNGQSVSQRQPTSGGTSDGNGDGRDATSNGDSSASAPARRCSARRREFSGCRASRSREQLEPCRRPSAPPQRRLPLTVTAYDSCLSSMSYLPWSFSAHVPDPSPALTRSWSPRSAGLPVPGLENAPTRRMIVPRT